MATPTMPLAGLDITPSYGAYQVGIVLASLFCGISTMQVYLYFWNYSDVDKWTLKGSVLFLWALDIANLALIIGGSWNIEVKQWGSITALETGQLLVMDHTEIEAVVIIVVQLYLIRRVWLFNKKKNWLDLVILCILPVLSAWQLIGDIVYQVFGYNKPLAVLSTPREVGLNISLRAVAAFVDIAVTLYLARLLNSQKSQGFSRTRQTLSRMLLVVVNTGLFTAILATITLILLASRPNDLYYLITELPLCSAYLSCFLANLNSRTFVRGSTGVISLVDTTFSTIPYSDGTYPMSSVPSTSWRGGKDSGGVRTQANNWGSQPVNIHIRTDQHAMTDSPAEETDTTHSIVKQELSMA